MSLDPRTIAREPRDRRVTAHDLRAGSNRYSRRHRASPHRPLARRLTAGGTTGNERLTTATGVVLLVLLAVIGVTILRLRSLLWVHLFVGMLLIGPIALKIGQHGLPLRALLHRRPALPPQGPAVRACCGCSPRSSSSRRSRCSPAVSRCCSSGHPRAGRCCRSTRSASSSGSLVTSLHVLGHLPEVAAAVGLGAETASKVDVLGAMGSTDGGDLSAWEAPGAALTARAGRAGRGLSLAGALAGGAVLAVAVIPQFGPWLHASSFFHHH